MQPTAAAGGAMGDVTGDVSASGQRSADGAGTTLSAVYPALLDADNRGDAQALADLGWVLFEMASTAQQAQREAIALLEELRLAARVAAAARGSPASIALLRRVLASHGWLPARGATPLQVLAAPGRSLPDPR
jgi:hypothetical protein